jgi:NifU-like protein involved in Fe-S cluster formation
MASIELTDNQKGSMIKAGYSEKAIKLFIEQVNCGKIEYPDFFEFNIGPCGDLVFLYLNLGKNEIIKDLKFHYIGCPALSSSCSALTLLVIGKKITTVESISSKELLAFTEGLPQDHYHCPVLVCETFKKIIKSYEKRLKLSKEEHDKYIHFCGLTGSELENLKESPCSNCQKVKDCENDHIIIKFY